MFQKKRLISKENKSKVDVGEEDMETAWNRVKRIMPNKRVELPEGEVWRKIIDG